MLASIENDAFFDISEPHLVLKRLADKIMDRYPNSTMESPVTKVEDGDNIENKFS